MIGIYKIENLINGHKYIGQSVNIERRWKDEKISAFNSNSNSYNYPLSRAFRKYGIENFSFEIIEEVSQEKLNERERYWIQRYDTFYNGYNQTLGGESPLVTKKEKIIGVITDLENTDMYHKEIAKKWNLSIEMVQGINTGRYWYQENKNYPLQKNHKKGSQHKIKQEDGSYLINKEEYRCKICKKPIATKDANFCVKCAQVASRKVVRPSREELKNLIRTTSFVQIGKQFGVSDNAIRKWCDAYNLPRKKDEIKILTDVEWELV